MVYIIQDNKTSSWMASVFRIIVHEKTMPREISGEYKEEYFQLKSFENWH